MSAHCKLLFFAIAIAFLFITAAGCATGKNVTISKEAGQVPPGFNPATDSLLVLKNTISGIGVGNSIKKAFKEYKYPYEIINSNSLGKYSTSQYRYMLYLSIYASGVTKPGGGSGPGTVYCIMEDRVTGKAYHSAGVPDYGHLLKHYVAVLNQLAK